MPSAQKLLDDPLDEVLRPPADETPDQRDIRLAREEEANSVSQAIDAEIKAERLASRKRRIVRLLLLGQSESGACLFNLRIFILPLTTSQVNRRHSDVRPIAL